MRVRLAGPLDLPASLEQFRRSGDDLVDRWDGACFRRPLPVPFAATVVAPDTLDVRAAGPGVDWPAALGAMVVQAPLGQLAGHDPVIAALDARHPGVRPVLQPDPFTALVRAISAQQVNLRWACTTRRRLVERFGLATRVGGGEVWRLEAARLAAADPAEVRALQFTTSKAVHLVALARLAADGGLEPSTFADQDDEEVVRRLTALAGVGRWTAEWFLARTLGRPVVVAGDLGVRKAVGLAYCPGPPGAGPPSEAAVRALAAHWGEAAGVAQQLLLHGLAEGTLPLAAPART